MTGLLRQGAFGTAADILNVDDGNVAHEKKTNEAEMRPFFFNVWLPESAPFALVCSLRISNDGIIGSLAQYLRDEANTLNEGIHLKIEPVVESQLFDQLIDGSQIKKIRMIRYSLPDDVSEYLGYSSLDPEEFEFEISVKARSKMKGMPKDQGIVQRFMNLGSDKYIPSEVSRLIALPGHEADNLKLETKTRSGRTKTYDAMRSLQSPMLYELDAKVTLGADGMPTFDSLIELTTEIHEDLHLMLSE